VSASTLRLGLIGAGWIAGLHLEALARLGRTELVGIVSGTGAGAASLASQWGGRVYPELEPLLDEAAIDVAYVCVPPYRAVAIGERLVERGIPFLTEKPLAATDAEGPTRLAAAIDRARLVVAVGYHLRALDIMPAVRERLADHPPALIDARWLGGTPGPTWWRLADQGGGQVVEQATHLYDLARYLMGEAEVVGAASIRDPARGSDTLDVADATASVLRFVSGAVGAFANTRIIPNGVVSVELASEELLTVLSKGDRSQGDWHATFDDGNGPVQLHAERDPYEIQASAFLDAVEAGDPSKVLSTYTDALATDRLTRAVVAATGTTA
jgi:myo-inositol 2-dehydrogenase/D-chiro-inositol 1-dehydrogenase